VKGYVSRGQGHYIPVHALTEGKHRLAYRLTTLENGTTNDSPSSSVEVDRTPPGNPLIAPIIFPSQTRDGLTSEELEGMGNVLSGTIASYKGMQAGDVIHTYWNNIPGPTAVVTKDDMGLKRIMVDFVRSFLESIGDIEAPVHYTITDLAGNLSMRSEPVSVKLQLTTVTPLPTPTVKEANGGTLDPANASSGATVVIDATANLKAGDQIIVQWQGPKGSDTKEKTLTAGEAGKALEVPFSAVLVTTNAGQTVAVSYVVNRSNGLVQTSDTLVLQVLDARQELELDTSPVTLAGKIYLIPGTPDLLPNFPADTTVQRQASGGQAPYSYVSSNPSVAKVDANGLVSVRGKGATTITVTDALSVSKSYPVSVTGVIHCMGVGTGSFSQVSKTASSIGARIPSIQELVEIHAAYGNRWRMGNGNYWSSTIAHAGLAGWNWYYVKNLVTGGNFKLKSHNPSFGVAVK
ncbi:Ig-like domain-containing protein, partial [Pseudomonas syringae]|uniref:Ig-like domain-containing protein n=1 Tax=Pseudomonas syringae TaxID=317 RepID=UPI00067F3E9B